MSTVLHDFLQYSAAQKSIGI